MKIGSSDHFFLYLHMKVAGNNDFMTVFNIILRNQSVVWNTLLLQEIHHIGLLQKGISDILFVLEDFLQSFWSPFLLSTTCQNTVSLQASANLMQTCTFQVLSVNSFDYFRSVWGNNQLAFFIFGISKKTIMIHGNLPLLITVLKP